MTKLQEKQRAYWQDRQLQNFMNGEEDALELSKKLKANYDSAVIKIQKEITAFYGKYAKEQGITIAEAKRILTSSEMRSFNQELSDFIEYGKNNDFSEAYLNELNLMKYRTNISRLQQLEANIKFEIAKLETNNFKIIRDKMEDLYDEAYLEDIFGVSQELGVSFSFAKPNTQAIKDYFSQDINIGNYSIGEEGIWTNKIPKLMNLLNVKIPQGIVLGYNPNKVAKLATDPIEKDFNNIVRVVRTEYNYIFNQASIDSYKECSINRYQILATLDERTCNDCGPLDLQVVNLEDREVGVNCPPFHPNCRCTTIPYFDPDEFDVKGQRIAKDKDGNPYMVPEDLTYSEWKRGLTEHEGGLIYWKP